MWIRVYARTSKISEIGPEISYQHMNDRGRNLEIKFEQIETFKGLR